MIEEQFERLTRIEDNIDKMKEDIGILGNALTKANGDIEKLNATLNGKVDRLETQMFGRLELFEQKFACIAEKIDQIIKNTSNKEDNKTRFMTAIAAAVIGAVIGALSRLF